MDYIYIEKAGEFTWTLVWEWPGSNYWYRMFAECKKARLFVRAWNQSDPGIGILFFVTFLERTENIYIIDWFNLITLNAAFL